MKKILFGVLALVAISVSFASCDSLCGKTDANDTTVVEDTVLVNDSVVTDSVMVADSLVDVE